MAEHQVRLLLGILAGALVVRLVLAFSVSDQALLAIDGKDYRDIATNLVEGRGYSVSSYRWFEPVPPDSLEYHSDLSRAPLLPLLGAAYTWLPGAWLVDARVTAALLGVLAVLLVYGVGRALFGGPSGLVAAAIMAVYPYAVYYSGRWSTENLALVCLWTAVWLWIRRPVGRSLTAILVGVALALAGLARPAMLLIAGAVILVSIRGFGFRRTVWMALATVLVLTPWMARNYTVTGVPTPATFFGPYDMWLGMNDATYEMYRHPVSSEFREQMDRLYSVLSEERVGRLEEAGTYDIQEVNRFWLSEYADYWRRHPGRAAVVQASRVLHYFQPIPTPGNSTPAEVALSAASVLPLMALGLLALWKDPGSRRAILGAVLAASFLGSLPFIFCLRFRYPAFDPMLVVLGGHGLWLLLRDRRWTGGGMRTGPPRRVAS